MKQDLNIIRCTNTTLKITVTDANGDLFDIGATGDSGYRIIFGVKKDVEDEKYLFTRATTVSAYGVYKLEIFPVDTENLKCGKYIYDVGMETPSGDFLNVIEASEFCLCKNVTKKGCAV